MRGLVNRRRKKRFLIALLAVLAVLALQRCQKIWLGTFATEQVDAFLGPTMTASIGSISGGVFDDIALSDVIIRARRQKGKEVFEVKRIELPYRLWDLAGFYFADNYPKDLGGTLAIYLSEDNAFLRGYIGLSRVSDREVRISGLVSPALFGQTVKKRLSGTFRKRSDRYDCRVEYGQYIVVEGELIPAEGRLELTSEGLAAEGGAFSTSLKVTPSGEVNAYLRMDRIIFGGTEFIGDVWARFDRRDIIHWSVNAEHLLVDRRDIWPVLCEGAYHPVQRRLVVNKVSWGDSIFANGEVELREGLPFGTNIFVEGLDLQSLKEMLPPSEERMSGRINMEVNISGTTDKALANGRMYIGEGVLGELEFLSVFATLGGELPVLEVKDARVVKEAGALTVAGKLDLRKFGSGDPTEDLDFLTDQRVAVWEQWQINKWDDTNLVQARKDNITLTTSFEDDSAVKQYLARDPGFNDMSLEYRLDRANSIKMDFGEDGGNDFMGLKHRMEF